MFDPTQYNLKYTIDDINMTIGNNDQLLRDRKSVGRERV